MAVMSGFKVGSRVKANGVDESNSYTGEVTEIHDNFLEVKKDGRTGDWSCKIQADGRVRSAYGAWDEETYLELLDPATETMEDTNMLRNELLDDDTKTLIKHGVLNKALQVDYTSQRLGEFIVSKFKTELAEKLRELEKETQKTKSAEGPF